MATALRSKSFQKNLLVSIGGIFLLYSICFGIYQHQREKDYKTDIMHSRLQMYNYEMMQTLGNDSILNKDLFREYVNRHHINGLRITVINNHGKVLLDSHEAATHSLENHLKRKEIQEALRSGNGYDIKRTSASTNDTYFYSATKFGNIIIRSAIPYSTDLLRSLQADNTYIYFAILLTVLLGIVLYFNTKRISSHIGYLQEFAKKAENGSELDHELERRLPDDELGDISHTIITLYWKLRHSEEDKERIKRQLTQNAAHELKTPTASIHGYLESILDNPEMPADKRQHFLERCFAQSERMCKLLLDMEQLTKLDERPHVMQKENNKRVAVDIVPIIHNVLEDTALQLLEKGISVDIQIPKKIMIFSSQLEPEGAIYSIFRNIIDNAIAYAAGATKITIKYNDGVFSLADNGQGVPAEHLPHLFERFYRVDKGRSRKLGGTGLGLAIVKNTVAAHGGWVMAESTPGGGLTIRFSLG